MSFTEHCTKAECILSSSTHKTLTKTDHILSHKTNLNKSNMFKITQYMFLDHNGIKLKMSNSICRKVPKYLKLNKIGLNKLLIKQEIKREI